VCAELNASMPMNPYALVKLPDTHTENVSVCPGAADPNGVVW
jgi:hypothetical protein